jgi:hypothetical protein
MISDTIKQTILDEFNKQTEQLFNRALTQCGSKKSPVAKKRDDILAFQEEHADFNFEIALGFHVSHAYLLRDSLFTISFDFPDKGNTLKATRAKTKVMLSYQQNYRRDVESCCITFAQFIDSANDFSYLASMIRHYDLVSHTQESPKRLWHNLLVNCLINDPKAQFSQLIAQFRDNEGDVSSLFEKKLAYITRRREVNRATKEMKKRGKGQSKQKITDNNQKIISLRRQIQALEQENINMGNKDSGMQIKMNAQSELTTLQTNYENEFREFWQHTIDPKLQKQPVINEVIKTLAVY